MAFRSDVTANFYVSPVIITVASPSTTITIQDLNDSVRNIEAQNPTALQFASIMKVSGKDSLGGSSQVGMTCTLQNAQLAFAARGGPSFVQCTVNGGNLLAVDANNSPISAINTTAYTQVIIQQSTSPTLVSTGLLKNVALPAFEVLMVNTSGVPTTGLAVSATRSIDGSAFTAAANSVTEIGSGVYRIDLAASDLNGKVITLRFTATGAADRVVTLVTTG